MPTTKGKKRRFSAKQDRQAAHVADSMKKRGMSAKRAKSVGYATVNKLKGKRKKSSADSQARNVESKKTPKRKPSKRRKRNIGRS
jgi:hypothetical protein